MVKLGVGPKLVLGIFILFFHTLDTFWIPISKSDIINQVEFQAESCSHPSVVGFYLNTTFPLSENSSVFQPVRNSKDLPIYVSILPAFVIRPNILNYYFLAEY